MDAKERLLKIIEQRTKDNPISQNNLAKLVRQYGFDITERGVRALIAELRKEGHLILSVSKAGGGYYMSASMDDYLDFRRRKFNAQILDMLETLRAMDHAADRRFNGLQERLF